MKEEKIETVGESVPETNVRRVEKTMVLSFASMLTTVIGIVLSMVFTRVLTKTDLAAYKQTFLAYETVAPFLSLGLTNGLNYVLVRNNGRKRAITNASMLVLVFTGMIYALFILFGGNRLLAMRFNNTIVSSLLLWMIPYAILVSPSTISRVIMVNEGKIRLCAVVSVCTNLFLSLTSIISALIFQNATSVVIANVSASIIISLSTIFVIYKYTIPNDSGRFNFFDIKTIIMFCLPLGISSMISTLDVQLDKFIVSSLLSAEEFAVYSVGAQELPLISTITGAISTVVVVDITKSLRDHKYDEAFDLFKSIARITTLFLFPVMFFLLVTADEFIGFLYTSSYANAAQIFRIYLLRVPISTVIYAPLLIGLGQNKKILQRSIISLVANAIISFIFVKIFGAVGAAYGTVIVGYCILIPFNMFTICKVAKVKWSRLLPFTHYLKVAISIIPITALILILKIYIKHYFNNELLFLCVTGVAFVAGIYITYKSIFKIDIVKIVINYLKSKLKRS